MLPFTRFRSIFHYFCQREKHTAQLDVLNIPGLKKKCEMNLNMADVLSQDKNQPDGWTTSIHCSYYAVFQYMKYLLAEKVDSPISYSAQDAHTGEDSHKYILEEIKNRISNSTNARKLGERVRNLRQQRVLADYKDHVFNQAESLDCHNEADAIIRNLTKLLCA